MSRRQRGPRRSGGRVSLGRRLAFNVLDQVVDGRRLDRAFETVVPRESDVRPWVRELCFGTVRYQGRLDVLLGRHVKKGLGSLEPAVLTVLRLGAYQLLFMDSVPGYAAVSQSVDQATAVSGRGAAGLVNAVLRKVQSSGMREDGFPSFSADPVAHLSTWESHPEWLVQRWVSEFGADQTRALARLNNQVPDVFLRPLNVAPDAAAVRLNEAGIPGEPLPDAPVVRLPPGTNPREALGVVEGVIQDPASSWVPVYAGVPTGGSVLDLCSAPGGKTFALSALGAQVVASDRSELRLRRVAEARSRLGADVPLVVADAAFPPFRSADAVFLDVPCSGTGTLRRHPDGKWRLTSGLVEQLTGLQRSILTAAADLVSPGGLLIYATCSLEREENQDQITSFLEGNSDFVLEPGPVPRDLQSAAGCLDIRPQVAGFDGAFAARLRRKA